MIKYSTMAYILIIIKSLSYLMHPIVLCVVSTMYQLRIKLDIERTEENDNRLYNCILYVQHLRDTYNWVQVDTFIIG